MALVGAAMPQQQGFKAPDYSGQDPATKVSGVDPALGGAALREAF